MFSISMRPTTTFPLSTASSKPNSMNLIGATYIRASKLSSNAS